MKRRYLGGTHLSLDERKKILWGLLGRLTLKEIAAEVQKDPTTVSKEIFKRRTSKRVKTNPFNGRKADEGQCPRLRRFPMVCDGCERLTSCGYMWRCFYDPNEAMGSYQGLTTASRKGSKLSIEELKRIDETVAGGLRKGQSLYVIWLSNQGSIPVTPRTLYNLIRRGELSVKPIDLRNMVKMKARGKYDYDKKEVKTSDVVERNITKYFAYMKAHPFVYPVQMDTVESGRAGSKCFLTIHFVAAHFMMVFLLDEKSAGEVSRVFGMLEDKLGMDGFKKIFPVILTDRGVEFSKPQGLEFDANGEQRCKVFYCDAYVSNQKGAIESNHRLLRYIVPKGTIIDPYTEKEVRKIVCAIASYPRRELDGETPFRAFEEIYGEGILEKLGIEKVDSRTVNLTPSLVLGK